MKQAVSQAQGLIGLLSLLAVILTTTGCESPIDQKQIVIQYKDALNSHSIDSLMNFYSDDITFTIPKVDMYLTGKEALRGVAAYDSVLNTNLQIGDVRQAGDTVFCTFRETNDWMAAAGISSAYYPHVLFIVEERKIKFIEADMADSSAQNFKDVLGAFVPWAQREHPEEFARMTEGGKFQFNGKNGETMVRLLKEWRRSLPTSSP